MAGNASLQATALAVLRVVTGLLYMQHGVQKLFHWPASVHHAEPVALFSLAGLAGILEFFGGQAIVAGWLTRPVAFLLCGEMAVAYWGMHFRGGMGMPDGYLPVVNGGDLAILFCFVFLYLSCTGPGRWSIDGVLRAGARQDEGHGK